MSKTALSRQALRGILELSPDLKSLVGDTSPMAEQSSGEEPSPSTTGTRIDSCLTFCV